MCKWRMGRRLSPEGLPFAEGGMIGMALALETVLAGIEMDPAAIVFGGVTNSEQVTAAYGSMAEAVKVAGKGGYRLIVVSSEVEPRFVIGLPWAISTSWFAHRS